MEKVLFVDIDGVLNSSRAMLSCREFDDRTCPPFRIPPTGDTVGARLINRAARETGARLVVASTWLGTVGPDYTMDWLDRVGIDPALYHSDPNVRYGPDGRKDRAILDWLHGTDLSPEHIVIVDDDRSLFAGVPQLKRRLVAVPEDD